jgi:hypothetical protein
MFKVSLVATALVVALSLSAQAQTKGQTDLCWDVNRPHGDQPNPIGTILIDRCSGKTFILWQATDQSLAVVSSSSGGKGDSARRRCGACTTC